jgi:hypothetical protein
MAVGGSEHLHRFNTGDVRLELRFDPTTRLVSFQGRSVPIGDDNVVLVDKVDDPSGPTIVGTMRVDRRLPDPAVGDPVQQIVKGSPKLAAFVQ